jgi:hypothetical protein
MVNPVTRVFLKVNQSPYLLVLDLFGDVNFLQSTVSIDSASREIKISLKKLKAGHWDQLAWTGSASDAAARRLEAQEEARLESAKVCGEISCAILCIPFTETGNCPHL